jgi:hypothetical protein
MKLSAKHLKTLKRLYEKPTRSDIKWRDVLSLLSACEAVISQREGSRVGVKLGPRRAVFHAPHPRKEMVKGAVEDVREFLKQAGVMP